MYWYEKYVGVNKIDSDINTLIAVKNNLTKFNSRQPLVSVVVIAHNEEANLLGCLWSLSDNLCDYPVEIIGIDNNSTDRTPEIFESLGIRWYNEKRKGPGYARQCGLDHARGKYYISVDADIIYPKYYINELVHHLMRKGVVTVSARYGYIPDKENGRFTLRLYEFLKDIHLYLYSLRNPELAVRGGVMAYPTDLGRKIGYKLNIKVGEDGSMAFGLKKYGKIKFIHSRRARAVTFTRTLTARGSLYAHWVNAIKKYMKDPFGYVRRRVEYEDSESNLLQN